MSEENRFGLKRYIPNSVKQEVRKRCGFGCVRCGLGFYDYEHFDPDFKDAKEHNASGITLLCMQCNQKRSRGILSRETVVLANSNPRCLQEGFTCESFDFDSSPIKVTFAGVTFIDCKCLIMINNTPVLSIKPPPPESAPSPYLLSGQFSDDTGNITLEIDENEWKATTDNWDIDCIGSCIKIRSGKRQVSLILKSEPPKHLIIEQLNMEFEGILLRARNSKLESSFDGGTNWSQWFGCSTTGCAVGISINNRRHQTLRQLSSP
jgi:hypothetical protein